MTIWCIQNISLFVLTRQIQFFFFYNHNQFFVVLTISIFSQYLYCFRLTNLHSLNSSIKSSNHLSCSNLKRKSLSIISFWIVLVTSFSNLFYTCIKNGTIFQSSYVMNNYIITLLNLLSISLKISSLQILFHCHFTHSFFFFTK